ncbi:MAG: class II fructose-bisphosphate aldolase [Parcubacteria group bacterium]|nr:class II fructose-bisphosphate aldolase [Parcubacteria group bacterium]
MQTLREIIKGADTSKKAIGHFNISTIEALWAIFDAAREMGEPVIIGVSEGERKFLGIRQTVALVKSIRDEDEYPIFLNADHSYSFESVKEAVDAGYDAVIFDGAKLPFKENIRITKQCADYARSVNPEIIVEGELGYIGSSSQILDEIPQDVLASAFTTPEQAAEYVEKTGIDLFAPSVGNVHGMLRKRETDPDTRAELGTGRGAKGNAKQTQNPPLDIELIAQIREAAGIPLVLHGGSGITDDDFKKAIQAGMAIVHINTEIRKAWRDAVAAALQENLDEVAPYKILQGAKEVVHDVVRNRIGLFTRK